MCKNILSYLVNNKYLKPITNMENRYYYYGLFSIMFVFMIGINVITFMNISKSLKIYILITIAITFIFGNFILGIKSVSENLGNMENKYWATNDCIKLFLPFLIVIIIYLLI
jgi:hypothetical protein